VHYKLTTIYKGGWVDRWIVSKYSYSYRRLPFHSRSTSPAVLQVSKEAKAS
jgi:hypothetical protein